MVSSTSFRPSPLVTKNDARAMCFACRSIWFIPIAIQETRFQCRHLQRRRPRITLPASRFLVPHSSKSPRPLQYTSLASSIVHGVLTSYQLRCSDLATPNASSFFLPPPLPSFAPLFKTDITDSSTPAWAFVALLLLSLLCLLYGLPSLLRDRPLCLPFLFSYIFLDYVQLSSNPWTLLRKFS